ncbi:hypothetical protein BC829DRAFT_440715 [Chytridium lagenaria]|nr:hypothetical protein BC829DRAFT_440715 [Chytridium lagenaria]
MLWKDRNPGFTVIVHDDADMLKLVTEEAEPLWPGLTNIYKGFERNVERADLLEVFTLILTLSLSAPLQLGTLTLTKKPRIITSRASPHIPSPEPGRVRQSFTFQVQWCQWAFGFRKGHVFLKELVDAVLEVARMERDKERVLLLDEPLGGKRDIGDTSDTLLDDADIVHQDTVIGSIGFLSPFAFGYRDGIDLRPDDDGKVFVRHLFAGSWKHEDVDGRLG